MATHQNSVSEGGKKRKRNETATLTAKPTKKVKASGVEFSERNAETTTDEKESAGLSDTATGHDHIENGQKPRQDKRNRPKVKDRSHTSDSVSKAERKEMRRELKRKEKRERKNSSKEMEPETKIEETGNQEPVVFGETSDLIRASQNWSSSLPSGGSFLPIDPIFVDDAEGKHLLLCATGREVQLISTSESLVVRSYSAPIGRHIKCFALDAVNEDLVHIVCDDDTSLTWDWNSNSATNGENEMNAQIHGITSGVQDQDEKASLFYVCSDGEESTIFSQGQLFFKTHRTLRFIRVAASGEYIVCHGPSVLVVGTRKARSTSEYIWKELPLTSSATCIDFRIVPGHKAGEKSSKRRTGLSVAVGFVDGRVDLYSDVSSLFDENVGSRGLPPPRILHWHRQAVSAVKFSPDGNYLLSGGTETVLVLWQLETGKKQYSPHLKAAIDRIGINSEGNRYALQMGDHSIMVLNSSDFKAVTYFGNLQATCPNEYTGEASRLPRISAALHPIDSSQLLIAVPSTQPILDRDVIARPFLQTFDTLRASHVRLQALQRNFTTEVNVAPDGSSLVPPDVVHLSISHDGAWLATVDEWAPAPADLEHMTADSKNLDEELQKRREVHLRIWRWDQTRNVWVEEYTRESPHSRINGDALGAGRVLGLVSDPRSNSFATIGEDGCARIWTCRQSKQDESTKWRCQHTIELPYARSPFNMLDGSAPFESSGWHLAYANDGSLLSVAYSKPVLATSGAPNEVYFINTRNGEIHSFKSGRTGSDIRGIAFLGRYYIALSSQAVYVWDFVDDRLMYKAKISSGKHSTSGRSILLASNQDGITFAVVVGSKVMVYDPRETKPLYKQGFEDHIQGILPSKGSLGYTLILDDNTIRTLSPSWASQNGVHQATDTSPALVLSLEVPLDEEQLEDELTADLVASVGKKGLTRHGDIGEEDDRPVVTPAQLEAICDPKADGTLPSVYDMFWGVVRMCARRPLVKA